MKASLINFAFVRVDLLKSFEEDTASKIALERLV